MSQRSSRCKQALTRRQFGALGIAGIGALVLPGCADHPPLRNERDPDRLIYAPGDVTPVAVAGVPRGAAPDALEAAVRAVARAATDFSWLSRGDTVLIKPACNSGRVYPSTTDPVALRAMIGLLREEGAGRIIVADMAGVEHVRFSKDHLRGSTRQLMGENGMASAVEAAGAEIVAFEEAGWDGFFEEAPRVQGAWSGSLMLPVVLREADHVIVMPRCARHALTGSTLGLKAGVGWWRHDARLEYHRDAASLAAKTADAGTLPTLTSKQRLVLTSATRVLTTFGPDQGYVARPEMGLVYASRDVVSHDMLSLTWLIENRLAMLPSDCQGAIDDPNSSACFVNLINGLLVEWLGGVGELRRAQRLQRHDLDTIWDDRVLRRAFENRGGVPRVEVADADGSVPAALRGRLADSLMLLA